MNYKICDLSQKKEWKKYLDSLPINQQDIYFTPEYYDLYERNGDGKAQCFVFKDNGDIALYPFLINSIDEIGYKLDDEYYDIQGAYGYNGVISSSYNIKFRRKFFYAFNEYCEGNNIIAEFTRFHPLLNNYKFSNSFMEITKDRYTVFLNLKKGYDLIWKDDYSSKNRNMIRKAHKSDIKSDIKENNIFINKFYEIYIQTMMKINAENYYFFSKEYFKNMLILLEKNVYILYINDNYENALCSMILFIYKKFAHYHLSGKSNVNTNNSINNFVLDESIKFAINKGCELFHFGGGNTSNKNDSLLKFKSNFSKERANYYLGKNIYNQQVYKEVVRQWEEKYPEKKEKYNNYLLKYRN